MTPEDIDVVEPDLDGAGLRVGIVRSRFNELHTKALLHACLAELGQLGVTADDVTCTSVPGALEIPFALRAMAESDQYDALIALGCVVRGETYHFEVVSNESARGVGEVALSAGIPIANAILTCDTDEQAAARTAEKGAEAARVAIEMANFALEFAPEEEDDEQ
ncbi:MAG TPA: 6,7-dimethyl-8-ribityllumazine synthase [Burkholderiaceae bacterium]|nr:6,7-dimethyl-8-ribityllumazine synthase [Burkholderiaceae bacterium]